MIDDKEIKRLKVFATCQDCGKKMQVKGINSVLPDHKDSNGKSCNRAGWSGKDAHYYIDTEEQAKVVAKWLNLYNRPDFCLNDSNSHPPHSFACRDGRACAEAKNLLVQALVTFTLN